MPEPAAGGPLVSVIIGAYNAAAFIRTSVESVLAERAIPLECVVVDDGSTDGTAAIVEELAAADPRVVVLRQPANAGISAARNRALDVMRGEWISYVDADDRLLPGGLAAMLRAAQADDARVVIAQRVSTDGTRTWTPAHHLNADLRQPGRKSLLRNHGLLANVGPVGKLFHRSCADNLRFAGRMMGDHAWVLRATVRAGDRVTVIADTVYEWRRPSPTRAFSTITADRERSIPLAIEAVQMAGLSWRTVSAEWAGAGTPAQVHALDVAYLERLARADLQKAQVDAVRRSDPACDALLAATAALLVALPADVVADTAAIADRLVRPTVAFWWRLPASARPALGALVTAATPAGHRRRGILRNPGTAWLGRGGVRGLAGVVLAWPHAVGSLLLERGIRIAGHGLRR